MSQDGAPPDYSGATPKNPKKAEREGRIHRTSGILSSSGERTGDGHRENQHEKEASDIYSQTILARDRIFRLTTAALPRVIECLPGVIGRHHREINERGH